MRIFTTILFIVFSFFANAQTFIWNGNTHIADDATINIPITVTGLPAAIDTNFGIAHICLNITHSYDADLIVKLVSPTGMSVNLIQDIGGSGNNFVGTCLGMDGTAFTNAQPPYSGIFFPASDVSAFNNGQNPNGTWTLVVTDVAAPDTGSIHVASIEFTNNPPRQIASSGSGAPVGTYVCATCVCPGGATGCDLLPDMTASAKEILQNHIEEPGFLYISNATPNIGSGPIDIYGIDSCFCGTTHVPCGTVCPAGQPIQHVIKQRVYQKLPGKDTLNYYDRFAGKMTFHAIHSHLHVDNWANYSLRTATSNPDARTWPIVAPGTKQSFCLINLGNCSSNPGECVDNNGNTILTVPNHNVGWHTGCGKNQGIYPGNYDVYSINLNDPIPLTGVCNGNYYIVSITDPDNNFAESDENNNWVAVPITLSQQNPAPTITPTGATFFCQGGSVTLTSNPQSSYLWSTGATTQSIVVTTAGTFTVSTNCNSFTSTSVPITTVIVPPNSSASVSIALTTGTNPNCSGILNTFSATPVNGGNLPFYQWKVNGINVGSNSPTYSTSSLTDGQMVSCELTSNISCLINSSATSNSITMGIVQPAVTISQTTGNNPVCSGDPVTFTAVVANGNNPVYQWKLNGANVGTNSTIYSSSALTNGQTIRCDISANATCEAKGLVGTAVTLNESGSNRGAAYPTWYGNGRQQYLIRASELTAMGLSAGRISSLSFHVAGGLGDPATLNNYTIKLGHTLSTVLTGTFQTPAFTTVFGPVNYTPVLNTVNNHVFSTPFDWNGVSNVVVDVCFANLVTGNAAYTNYQTSTSFVSTTYYQADGTVGAGACTRITGPNTSSIRPNMIFSIAKLSSASSNTITIGVTPRPIYTFTGSGNWNVASNWSNNTIPPSVLSACGEIIVDPPLGQECILNVPQTVLTGGKLTVVTSKKFRVMGNLTMQ